jgi:hypothetical protein
MRNARRKENKMGETELELVKGMNEDARRKENKRGKRKVALERNE